MTRHHGEPKLPPGPPSPMLPEPSPGDRLITWAIISLSLVLIVVYAMLELV